MHDLPHRDADLGHQPAELAHALGHARAGLLPRRAEALAVLLDVGLAGVGQLEDVAAVARLALEQALVGEQLERGVDRAGARPPDAAGARFELLHDLVAVARLLLDEQQDRRADVAAADPPAAPHPPRRKPGGPGRRIVNMSPGPPPQGPPGPGPPGPPGPWRKKMTSFSWWCMVLLRVDIDNDRTRDISVSVKSARRRSPRPRPGRAYPWAHEGRPPRQHRARAPRRRDRPRRRARDRAEARRAGRARPLERRRAGPAAPLEDGKPIQILTTRDKDDPDALYVLRHSSAHLLAEAVRRLYPGVKVAIGPPIENGFYYDFDFPEPITEADLERIEEEVERELAEGREWSREATTADEARARFEAEGEPYKVELVDTAEGEISLYTQAERQSEFTDLCRGPHLQNSAPIKALKLDRPRGRLLARRREEQAADPHLRHRVLLAGRPRRAPRAARGGARARPPPARRRSSTSSTSPTSRRARRSGTRRGW